MTQDSDWKAQPILERSVNPTVSKSLVKGRRFTIVTLSDDGTKLFLRVLDGVDALPTLKELDDTQEMLLYVGFADARLVQEIASALGVAGL